jgi:O-antigen ligase
VFAFGAVHPWAQRPLLVALLSTVVAIRVQSGVRAGSAKPLLILSLLFVPTILQVLPVSPNLLFGVAPANYRFLQELNIATFADTVEWHPLSVVPVRTITTVVYLAVGAIWIGAISIGLRRSIRPASLAQGICALAAAVAVLGLAQKATFNGKIYWFWESQFGAASNYYGPFINRNHFAGWMLLALALGTGYFLGLVAQPSRHKTQNWRDRLLWLSSPEAGTLLAVGTVLTVMGVSLVWTMSRSGIGSAAAAITLLGLTAVFRMPGKTRKKAAGAAVVIGLTLVAAWRGVDTIAAGYADTRTFEWRVALWNDSLPALRDFYRLGSGLNTYGTVMLLYPQSDPTVHAQQAHNDYLQFAIEGGLLVGIPALLAAGLLIRRIWTRLRQSQDELTWWLRMGAVAGIAGMAIQELTEFSLQIPGVAVLFAVLVAVAIHEPATMSSPRERNRPANGLKPSSLRPDRHALSGQR